MGDTIGDFQIVDSKSSNILHSTYACILVVVDMLHGLPKKIKLEAPNGSWIQTLDYKGIPFHCRFFSETSHVVAHCLAKVSKSKKRPSWWSRALVQHYSVLKDVDLKDVPQFVGVEGDSCPTSTGSDIDSLEDMAERGDSCPTLASLDLDSLEDMAATSSPSSTVRVLLVNGSKEILPTFLIGSVGKALVWEKEASRMEEGWTKVK